MVTSAAQWSNLLDWFFGIGNSNPSIIKSVSPWPTFIYRKGWHLWSYSMEEILEFMATVHLFVSHWRAFGVSWSNPLHFLLKFLYFCVVPPPPRPGQQRGRVINYWFYLNRLAHISLLGFFFTYPCYPNSSTLLGFWGSGMDRSVSGSFFFPYIISFLNKYFPLHWCLESLNQTNADFFSFTSF